MALALIPKQPFEEINYAVDFSPDLAAGVTLTLVSCTAVNVATGADSTAAVIAAAPPPAVAGQTVAFCAKDGTDGDVHKITVKVSTSAGEKLEADLDLFIVEK